MEELKVQVMEGLEVTVIPDDTVEFYMPTRQVAEGYGVSMKAIRKHLSSHKDEMVEGIHYVMAEEVFKGATKSSHLPGGFQPKAIYYTKAGVVRLGFFIKSEKAKLFRDWAEKLVLKVISREAPTMQAVQQPVVDLWQVKEMMQLKDELLRSQRELLREKNIRLKIQEKQIGGLKRAINESFKLPSLFD